MPYPIEPPARLLPVLKAMHEGKYYDPGDPDLMRIQTLCLERVYAYNQTRPTEPEKREALLRELLGGMGEKCYLEPPVHANWGCHTFLGRNVYANFNLTLTDDTYITIEDDVMIGPNVTIVTAAHPIDPEGRAKGLQCNKPVRICKNVWLGAGVIVLPGVTIGENTTIGAGSVVTKDIPANVVALGSPCRVVRTFTEKDRDWRGNTVTGL
jgi:galactoside O-acetyltransferase